MLLERRHRALAIVVVGRRGSRMRNARIRIAVVDEDHAIGVGNRERPQQHVVDDGKEGGARGDPERERRGDEEGEHRMPAQHPRAVLHVARQRVDERRPRLIVDLLFDARLAAERAARGIARIGLRETALSLLFRLDLQVDTQLAFEIVVVAHITLSRVPSSRTRSPPRDGSTSILRRRAASVRAA